MKEILLRALIGGVVVSAFALLGSVLKPMRFAGLFGAAPSVALASLGLTVASHGKLYGSLQGRSMVGGAIAFLVYAYCVCVVMMSTSRLRWPQPRYCSLCGRLRRLAFGSSGYDRREMRIRFDLSKLRQTTWYEYALRFLFGGAISAVAAVISKKFGPEVGGLFLAFPAIFPSGATLIEKHEREKKERKGLHGTIRGRTAAGVDAAGAAMGACGLVAFAVLAWKLLPYYATWAVLLGATLIWLGVSVSIWASCGRLSRLRRKRRPKELIHSARQL